MRTLVDKFDKARIAALPRALFAGRVYVVIGEKEAEKAVDFLMTCPLLGIDTETRPSFKKGQMNKVALLQVSTDEVCFLFRLNRMGLPACLVRLLENKAVTKVGLSLRDDVASLHRRADFTPQAMVDLQQYVADMGVKDMSLQKIYANVFGEKISKGQQLTNWEADSLTEGQQRYAATDAWACVRLYRELAALRESGDYVLERTETAEDPQA